MSLSRLGCRGGLGFALAVAVLLALGGPGNGQPGSRKQPVPKKAALDKATALIGELYREDLIQATRGNYARLKLAQAFLIEARETTDDPAGKYVLLREAWLLAGQAGDAAIALQALEDSFPLKLQQCQATTASQAVAP